MDQYSNYGGQQDPSSTGYNYQSYNDAYSQSGYTAPTNTSEYYYGGNNTPAGGNGNESSGTNPQPTAPPSASSQGYTSREGYEVNGYSSSYNYGNYPPSATSGNYQAGPGSSGGSTTQQYNGTNKTGYADRDNDYGDGPGYSSNKNPYDGYGGNYKSRENNREGYGPPSKDGSYDSYGNRPKDGSVVQTSTDTVYISNLSKDVTEEKLADYFGGLGMLKIDKKTQKPKIWIYYDKASGLPKGDATLTYEDPDSTAAAIKYFDNQPFLGQVIKVEMSVRKIASTGFRGGRSRGRGRGGFSGGRGGRGGPPPREGDWVCKANNFARRMECYKCHVPRAGAPGDGGSYGSRYSGSPRGGYRGRRGGGPSYGGSRYGDDDRGYGGGGYRNNDNGYGYDQGYGRQSKQDERQERRDNSRYRPY
ncbi:hypothetical protein C2G38_587955 [Gigaspora rosea]|uniref:RRM domain-containing protein n=1 Tax=Gigaspora rosea TaxID=44941 RepID=A0A397U8X7_9GLOM|nr:hypothetical protein C2G38_587955 [Gigaspora rosea]